MITTRNRNRPPDAGDELPPAPRNAREAERLVIAEALQALRHAAQTLTSFAARFAGRYVNDVLQVETITFDASGLATRSFHVAVGAVEVNNVSGHTVTVQAGAPTTNTVPGNGVGVYQVAAGTSRTINVASRSVALFGTAADTISVQYFAAGAAPTVA